MDEDYNTRFKAQMSEWQHIWHDWFDADVELARLGEFERPDPIPERQDTDFRLICGLSQALPETRRLCFEIFEKIDVVDARSIVDQMGEAYAALEISEEEIDWTTVEIFPERTDPAREKLNNADNFSYLLEAFHETADFRSGVASTFLTEPLYMSAGNWYQPGDWIKAVLSDPRIDRCRALDYQLWRGGWRLDIGETLMLMPR
jgi:hypothetical protein